MTIMNNDDNPLLRICFLASQRIERWSLTDFSEVASPISYLALDGKGWVGVSSGKEKRAIEQGGDVDTYL